VIEIPLYEYVCDNCGHYEERLEFGSEVDREHACPSCKTEMNRLVSLCKFKLEYNNKTDICDWNGNSSHYWDDYKKAKSEGQDVKPFGED
jgi:putative FmdB family regulatory protein